MWQDSRINALNDDIDCLLIMGGTNDGAQGVTIGDMSRDNVNTDTFVGAYNVLLSKVFYKYYRLGSGYSGITQISEVNPIQIMIATPIYCNDSNYGNMDEIAEAVRGVANLWSIPVADQHAKVVLILRHHLFISLIMSILMMKAGKRLQMYGLMR